MKVQDILILLCLICFSKSVESSKEETHEFQAEVSRMMDIIINSLYTDKEIFLRELVSNSADALDKIRFQSIQDPECLGDNQDLSIKVSFDEEKRIIQIEDSGLGMTKQDMIQNLGTLAKSGTTNFMEHIKSGNMNLIGQFGVGFYSAFLVANKVQVYSKHNDDKLYLWESSAANSFTISENNDVQLTRGSIVVLHLKQDALEFANEQTIKNLLQRYSEFITFPIYLQVSKTVTKEVPSDEEDTEKITVESTDAEDQKEIEDQMKQLKMKKVTETVKEWDQQNLQKPIWVRDKTEVELEEYQSFYKAVFKQQTDFQTYSHFRGEGEVEFKALIFIPRYQQMDHFSKYHDKSQNMKLYVRRVLIQDRFEDLCPKYLNFVEGIIDSDDLPLNVNREGLQQLKLMKVISKKIVKKSLDMIIELSKDSEKYDKFWKEFGRGMKFGLMDDKPNREKLTKLVRFASSHNTSQLTSFDQYIERMKEGQDQIYYIAGESVTECMNSPIIQSLIDNNFEVLLLSDAIDEFALNDIQTYEGRKLINIAKGEFKLPQSQDDKKQEKKLRKMYSPLTEMWQKIRKDQFQEVILSKRLTQDPCVVVGVEGGYSANQERIQKAQAHGEAKFKPKTRMMLEINPSHPIIKKLLQSVNQKEELQAEQTVNLLSDTALVVSGFGIENKQEFSSRFYSIIRNQFGISEDEQIKKVEFDENEQDDDIEEIQPQKDDNFSEFNDLSENDNIPQDQEPLTVDQINNIVDDL